MTEKKVRVRQAEPKDVVNICKLLRQGWNEQTVEYAPVDDLRGYKWILGILEQGFIAVADLNGRIVGAACASPFQPSWSTVWMLDVEFLYVLPNFRRDGIAASLTKAVEGFADKFNLPMIFIMQTGDKPLVKDRMMKIAGWQYAGGTFVRQRNGKEQETDNGDKAGD